MKHFTYRLGLSVLFSLCCLYGSALKPSKASTMKRAKAGSTLEAAMESYLKAPASRS